MKAIILMGIKHCGKSTQGRLLSRHLGLPFFDTDAVIESQTGRTAREIYTQGGEAAFKQAELEACRFVASQVQAEGAVIATGGGICTNAPAVEALRPLGTLVFLHSPERTAADRIVREIRPQPDGTPGNLPAYIARRSPRSVREVRSIFHDFYVERVRQYAALADVRVRMANASKAVNMNLILQALGLPPAERP